MSKKYNGKHLAVAFGALVINVVGFGNFVTWAATHPEYSSYFDTNMSILGVFWFIGILINVTFVFMFLEEL